MKDFLNKLFNYELEANVGFDPGNTAINMAIIAVFVIVTVYAIKKI